MCAVLYHLCLIEHGSFPSHQTRDVSKEWLLLRLNQQPSIFHQQRLLLWQMTESDLHTVYIYIYIYIYIVRRYVIVYIYSNKLCYRQVYNKVTKPIRNCNFQTDILHYIYGLVQERCNSIANALELHLSCTSPSICCIFQSHFWCWRQNILGKLGQHQACCCPSSLHHQNISNLGLNSI